MNESEFIEFINNAKFVFAKSMASIPHEYTLPKWNDDTLFNKAISFIKENGSEERFYKKTYTYLRMGGKKYWVMPELYGNGELINRCDAD